MPTNIYILKLQGGNYYVGKSADPEQRIQQHFDGVGSKWTQIHKPLKVERIIRGASDFDKDRYIKEYISKYGVDKVRGGAYVNIHLNKLQVGALERKLRGASDSCVRCGRQSHSAPNCYARKDKHGKQIEESDEDSSDNDTCYRCGRDGHFSTNCYARRDIDGDILSDDSAKRKIETSLAPQKATHKMPTSWTPFPTYSLVYTPLVGGALDYIKSRYIDGKDYYQSAPHEPPIMNDALINEFNELVYKLKPQFIETYNKEFGTENKRTRLRLEDHFIEFGLRFGVPDIVVKVEKTTTKIAQLVEFERWVRATILGDQQRREQAWMLIQEQHKDKQWPEPNSRDIIMFMAIRIQSLEEQVAKLLDK